MSQEPDPRKEILLIDLSSLAHPIWHVSESEPDPNATSRKIIGRVRALATRHPHAAICCDSGKSFRHELSADYKANRPESDARLHHQIKLAIEQFHADGFPVWKVAGFEADDLVATAACKAVIEGRDVLIVSADKDLLQLVGDGIRQMRPEKGDIFDVKAVQEKFGISPNQIVDYLSLVGDASDNVIGAKGIGPKTATKLLQAYGSIVGIMNALREEPKKFTPSTTASLQEFATRAATVQELITLRFDVPIPFDSVLQPRVASAVADFVTQSESENLMDTPGQPTVEDIKAAGDSAEKVLDKMVDEVRSVPTSGIGTFQPRTTTGTQEVVVGVPTQAVVIQPSTTIPDSQAPAIRPSVEVMPAPAPSEYHLQLDPRSLGDARLIASDLYKSAMFSDYGTPQAVLSTIMLGRELGLPAMASLRQIRIIEGQHALSASLIVALVLKSGFAEYFEIEEFDETHATVVTKRVGARKEQKLTHTVEMARLAGLVKDKSNWVKIPTEMCLARAQARLARLVYPDVVGGLYDPEELSR